MNISEKQNLKKGNPEKKASENKWKRKHLKKDSSAKAKFEETKM